MLKSTVGPLFGWGSSIILVLTIGYQVLRQWRTKQSAGISKWLFIGQMAASAGFTTYSAIVGDPVFVITNSILLVSAMAGLYIWYRNRSLETKNGKARTRQAPAAISEHAGTHARAQSSSCSLSR